MDTPIRALLVAKSAADADAMRASFARGGLAFSSEWIATESQCRQALARGSWDLICCSFLSLPLPSAAKAFEENRKLPLLLAFTDGLTDEIVEHASHMKALIWPRNALPHELVRIIAKKRKRQLMPQKPQKRLRRRRRMATPALHNPAERGGATLPASPAPQMSWTDRAELQAIANHTSQGLILFALDHSIVKCNPAFERIVGYEAAQIVAMHLYELIHHDDLPTVLTAVESLFKGTSDVLRLDFRLVGRLGQPIWSSLSGTLLPAASAEASPMVLGIFDDLTEKIRLEEAVRSSESMNSLIVDSIFETVYLLGFSASGEYIVQSVNDAYLKLTGFKREELIGMPVRKVIPEPTLSGLMINFDLAIAERRTVAWNTVVEYPSGRAYVETTATPLFDAHDRCIGIVGGVYDLTARVLAERKIAEQAEFLDHVHDAVFVCDLHGKIQYWNEGATRLYGWTREEALSRNIAVLTAQAELRFFEAAAKHSGTLDSWSGEQRHRSKSGKDLTVEASLTLMRNELGEPQHILGINLDVTEKRKLESQIVLAQRMESLSAIARSIAHDFNNILTTIIGNVGLARRLLPSGHLAQKKLTVVHEASHRAVDLARQILTFSRHSDPKRGAISLRPVVEQALRLLRASLPGTIKVRTHFSPESVEVLASATQIHQMVIDFGLKAAHAIGARQGHLDIGLELVQVHETLWGVKGKIEPGHYMRLSAKDDGEGMDEAALERYLAPGSGPHTPQLMGAMDITALLAIVDHHKGIMIVSSKLGCGTTFCVYFPLAEEFAGRSELVATLRPSASEMDCSIP